LTNITNINDTTYRYELLLHAIDFFTQRFNLDQLSNYAFKFSNELLNLDSSALFIKENEEFVMKKVKSYNIDNYKIKNSLNLQNIATFHGNIIMSNFENFFKKKDINKFNTKLIIPLIIDELLYGFIISNGKSQGNFEEDDYIICYALMRLINNCLENIKHISDLQYKNKQLDRKIFNLFAINHSSKTLLSELNLQNLYFIATDIFSEITTSKVTSFGLYDDISKKINILGYKNVSNFSKYYTQIDVHTNVYNSNKIVLDFNSDLNLIKSIFINWEEFVKLNTKYIVLLVKNSILGIVTLSESVNESIYDKSTFELIESLASFTYIALSNAILFKKVKEQKKVIEKKFNTLSKLNNLIKNINSCLSIEELCSLTLKTLKISFGIKKGFIAFKNNNSYAIQTSIGFSSKKNTFILNENWNDTYSSETIYYFSKDNLKKFFKDEMLDTFGSTNCLVISPITIDNYFSFELNPPIGYLVILETQNSLQEEDILLIDTIAKNISPIINQMNIVLNLKEYYVEDTRKKFLNNLKSKFEDKQKYLIDFNLYYKKIEKHPFKKLNLVQFSQFDYYLIDNYIFIISYDDLDYLDLYKVDNINNIDDVINFNYK
jgi:hypothetical protein